MEDIYQIKHFALVKLEFISKISGILSIGLGRKFADARLVSNFWRAHICRSFPTEEKKVRAGGGMKKKSFFARVQKIENLGRKREKGVWVGALRR